MEPESAAIFRAALRRGARRARRYFARFSVGIAARLALAFAAVAILAVAANLILERGVAVVETTRLDRGQFSSIPDSPTRSAAPVLDTPSAADSSLGSDALIAVIQRFERTIRIRASIDSSGAAEALRAAQKDLGDAVPPSVAQQLHTSIAAFELSGMGYVASADERRGALQEYRVRLESLDQRVSASLDGAFKLFGRVLARQSLMRLHSDIEELRHRTLELDSAEVDNSSALESLADGERELASSLKAHESAFARSEGEDWVRQMRADAAQIALLHGSIVDAGNDLHDRAQGFSGARARLLTAISAIPYAKSAKPIVQPSSAAAVLPRAIASPIVGVATTTTTTTSTRPDRGRRIAVGSVTAAVLLVLLAISLWTVRSILVPVSRMIEATRKLASGNVAVRVPRGGMKELDTLAVAFNRMAAQLRAARNITQDYRQHLEAQVEQRTRLLQHLAEHDPLTLLANRRQFFILLDRSLQRARETECGVAVFFIDLDNFKNLNDSMGHAFGDRVLISVAQRLEETSQSFGFAARLGGDEFTVVHEEIDSQETAYQAGRTIVEAFQQSLSVQGREVTVSVSVGASLYPDHELRAEDLLSAADAALFHAKALGRNQLAIYTPELLETASRKFTTEQGVRRALERDEFELLFQPEVRLDSLQVGLVEALVRWRLPDGRLATPDEFLAVTEESGLIIDLGNWVLRRAIATASIWHHGLWPEAKIAINVSPRQLIEQGFVGRVQGLLEEFRLPPRCIELELTESVLQTGSATIESLRLLRSLDIAIALDDFGTGYSSLASLEQLPLSRIKLDRTLIAGIDTNARSAAIAAALIQLCDNLGMEVTAEGVERDSQLRSLAGNRAIYLQGYLISQPLPASEVPRTNRSMPQIMQDLLMSIPATRAADSERRATRGVSRQELTAASSKR